MTFHFLGVLTIIGKKNSRDLLQRIKEKLVEITEGTTKILVPEKYQIIPPPKEPVFFNTHAKLTRDFSILAYSAFWEDFDKPKIFLDGLAGLGARSLRVANEIPDVEAAVANDINSEGLNIALNSMKLNEITNFETSEKEVCQFFGSYSKKGKRGSIVDVDPFGTPTKYFDCAIRATMHGGMLSVTATDLQVLHGLSKRACQRKYHGVPIKTEYSNEIAIRLILGCLEYVAGRLDIQIIPQFVQHDMHYYRAYLKILNKPGQKEQLGYIIHCKSCGSRKAVMKQEEICEVCDSKLDVAGPLWIGQLFEKEFVMKMTEIVPKLVMDKRCEKILEKCVLESEMPPTYYTLDEIASKMQSAPLKMKNMIKKLQDAGFAASPTSLNPNGFRTDCKIDEIIKILGFEMMDMKFKTILETKGRDTGKKHRVWLLAVKYEEKLYISRRNTNSDWLKNAQKNPDVRIEFDRRSFAGRASLVSDDSLCKKISQLKYDDEKRANEPRVVLEVDYN